MASTTRQQDVGEQQGLFGLQNNAQANLNQQYGINAGITTANAANGQKGAAGAVQLGAMALGALASDERQKEGIAPATGSADKSLAPGVVAKDPGFLQRLSQGLSAFGGGSGSGAGGGNGAGGAMFTGDQMAQMSSELGGSSAASSGGGDATSSIPGADMLSDENSKEAFRGIHPYQFQYKDGIANDMAHDAAMKAAKSAYAQAFSDAKSPRMGVMAQDLARNPETRPAVVNTNEGLAIDGKRALGLVLASQADFNDRLRAVESKHGRAS
jgi:hypothetical protein